MSRKAIKDIALYTITAILLAFMVFGFFHLITRYPLNN